MSAMTQDLSFFNPAPAHSRRTAPRAKKGQFFIISAVIIISILLSLSRDINTEWNEDISRIQANEAPAILENIEYGIIRTMASSGPSTEQLSENLERFAIAKKESLKERYFLDIYYNVTQSEVAANITLKSDTVYIEKFARFDR